MSAVTSEAVGGRWRWARVMGSDTEVRWVSSSDEVPEAALRDTFRSQAAGPLAKRLSAWGQTA